VVADRLDNPDRAGCHLKNHSGVSRDLGFGRGIRNDPDLVEPKPIYDRHVLVRGDDGAGRQKAVNADLDHCFAGSQIRAFLRLVARRRVELVADVVGKVGTGLVAANACHGCQQDERDRSSHIHKVVRRQNPVSGLQSPATSPNAPRTTHHA
jgi:hypothetical protein